MCWSAILERHAVRYADGLRRLPEGADARQRQLVRVANAAAAAGLAELMAGRVPEARTWLLRSAERYRESWVGAPAESWGRPIGALKARLLAGDRPGAEEDARWALGLGCAETGSPIGRYAAALAMLVLGDDAPALRLADALRADDGFPDAVADALAGLASGDSALYRDGVAATLASFEAREDFLEDVPVADTVLALEALAEPRGLTVRPRSPVLP